MATPEDISKLDVVLTAGCNLRCSYCYQTDQKPRRMDWDTLQASADLLLRSRRDEVKLLFIGGEPLLEFGLMQRAVAYVDAHRRPGQRVIFQTVTNGTLLRDEHAEFFAEHGFDVQLSFDGVEAAQALRGRGTFHTLDLALDHLRAQHSRFFEEQLSVSLTLVVPTIRYLAESIDYFLRKDLREVAVSAAITHQPEWRHEMIGELDEQFARISARCRAHYDRTGRVPFVLFRRAQEESAHAPDSLSLCGVGRGETPAGDVDGQVHGCLMFANSYQVFPTTFLRSRLEALQMGHIGDPALERRMATFPARTRAAGIFHGREHKYSSYGRCAECRFMTTCGVCPVSIGHQPGNTDPDRIPDFLCAYNLVSLKHREQFPVQPDLIDVLCGQARIPDALRELEAFAASVQSDDSLSARRARAEA
jgi:sulfatase maturation enzyme AslB (radical SAM superfamily)